MQSRSDFLTAGALLLFLSGFAFAQPLFDLLARNGEFLVAHRAEPVDVFVLTLLLSFLPPLLLISLESITLFSPKLQRGTHVVFVAALLAITALPIVKRLEVFRTPALLVLAGVFGTLLSLLLSKLDILKQRYAAWVLALMSIVFPTAFLLNSQISTIVWAAATTQLNGGGIIAKSPIVMVVFDEFPTTSLMNEQRTIDSSLYPNFADLASRSYWFRNATTVSSGTSMSVPAILTGKNPDIPQLPTVEDYPSNLFTLLGGSYDLKVFETVTRLCPDDLCSETSPRNPFRHRMRSLLSDLLLVYLHVELPKGLTDRLPSVTENWANFRTTKPKESERRSSNSTRPLDRRQQFERFVNTVQSTRRPTFFFLHVLLPHVPWSYLPSGKNYEADVVIKVDGWSRNTESWIDSEFVVNQAFQRHLLQVGYVDNLLGQLVQKLRAEGLYEESMIIITADHGVSFRPGQSRRTPNSKTYQDILPVPLIVKKPFQKDPVISDRNIETVDILASIADVLEFAVPWKTDGLSAFSTEPARSKKRHLWPTDSGPREFVTEPLISEQYATLRRKIGIFGRGPHQEGFSRFGPHSNLIGEPLSRIVIENQEDFSASIYNERDLLDVRLDHNYLPARISGELTGEGVPAGIAIGLGINGVVRAVAETFRDRDGVTRFSVMVPENAFSEGENAVDVFSIRQAPGGPLLSRVLRRTSSYQIVRGEGSSGRLTRSDGSSWDLVPDVMKMSLRSPQILGNRLIISGWAADKSRLKEPQAVLLFSNGEFIAASRADVARPDVASHLGAPEVQMTGFAFDLPLAFFGKVMPEDLAVYALSRDGEAGGLRCRRRKPGSRVDGALERPGSGRRSAGQGTAAEGAAPMWSSWSRWQVF